MATAILMPIMPSPPMPAMPTIFEPSAHPLRVRGSYIVAPAHKAHYQTTVFGKLMVTLCVESRRFICGVAILRY